MIFLGICISHEMYSCTFQTLCDDFSFTMISFSKTGTGKIKDLVYLLRSYHAVLGVVLYNYC
jgi:hypothetical protein